MRGPLKHSAGWRIITPLWLCGEDGRRSASPIPRAVAGVHRDYPEGGIGRGRGRFRGLGDQAGLECCLSIV